VIYLPKFYIDFENKDGRDAGKDIALEVESSKQQTLTELCLMFVMMEEVLYQLLLISLDFIEQGPIVQIKSGRKKKRFCMIEIKKLSGMGR
jgi:carboxyl-terminal processing protease